MNLQSHLDYATNEIMNLVDKYVLSCVMKEKEIKVNKIEPGRGGRIHNQETRE